MMLEKQHADLCLAFQAAKPYLSDNHQDTRGKAEFICWALEHARDTGRISRAQQESAKALVDKRLGKYTLLSAWLRQNHPELSAEIRGDRNKTGRKMQQTRMAWLDSLIEEFSPCVEVAYG